MQCVVFPLREHSTRFRHERNIYRAKYNAVKDICTCGATDKMKSGECLKVVA